MDALSQVYNQVIAVWVAVPLFLEKKKIENLAFLGLCVFPFAPIPFVGIFIIFSLYSISLMQSDIKKKNFLWIKEIFSIQNICAAITILPIFSMFYAMNTATVMNSSSILFVPLKAYDIPRVLTLLLFYFIEFGLFSILIYPMYKKDSLYWIIIVSLIIIPVFKIGGGRDFCMNASLPALYMLMIYVINYLMKLEWNVDNKSKIICCSITFTLAFLSPTSDVMLDISWIRTSETFPIVLDDIQTLSDKPLMEYENFLIDTPENTFFYKYISRCWGQKRSK